MAVQCCWADVWIQTIQPKILLNVSISLPQNKRVKRSTDLRCIWERSCDHELCTSCIGIALFLFMYWCVCVFFLCIIFIIIENDCNEYIDRNHCVYTIRGLKQSWLSVVRIKFLFVCYSPEHDIRPIIFTPMWECMFCLQNSSIVIRTREALRIRYKLKGPCA